MDTDTIKNQEIIHENFNYEYNALMSALQVSVSKHLMDEYFTVIWANDYFYERTLYTKEEYEAKYGNRCSDYFKQDPEEYAKFASAITEAIANNAPGYSSICKMPQKGGGYIWIKITGTFTDEKVNGIPVIYSVFTDVTAAVEQKELQKKLENQAEQLKSALQAAESANRAKSDFLSRMSHDIRTPMNAIVGMTEIAGSHLDDIEKVSNCLKKISLSSQHLLGLINDVLDMSKIESGKMALRNDSMLLPEVLENVIAIIQPMMKSRKQKFSIRLRNVVHEQFYCDSLRLRQVFINILSNASKFTPDNGSITLNVEELDYANPGEAGFCFTFCDTGIGIAPEFINHIFDAFTREKDGRVSQTEGTGLGMAITQKIVEMMGGTITVESELDKGTTFRVCLPLKIESQPPGGWKFPGLKVLVADDDVMMCEYTAQMLEDSGVDVTWVNNGVDAVKAVVRAYRQGNDYDAVIIDWKMPGQDGVETVRAIRGKVNKDVPILIVSAYDWTEIEEDAIDAGANGFLPKPLFRSTLFRGLSRYVLGNEEPSYYTRSKERQYDFSGKKILLIEDNELNREIAIELLSDTGAKVDYACDGAEGVKAFETSQEREYDLILMDIQMPVMDGYTAAETIRKSSRKDAAKIPILAMTADAFAEDIIAAKEAGMNGHIAKPLDMAELKKKISRLLDK